MSGCMKWRNGPDIYDLWIIDMLHTGSNLKQYASMALPYNMASPPINFYSRIVLKVATDCNIMLC